MHIDGITRKLPLPARRVFRLSLTVGLTLVLSYALARPLPYIAPLLAFSLTAKPGPPLPLKGLVGLLVLVFFTTSLGLMLIPVLLNYSVVGLILVALGLYLSNDLSLNRGKGAVGAFMTVGLTLITAAGVGNFGAARMVADELAVGIALAVIGQRIVYPLFPEDPQRGPVATPPAPDIVTSRWMALRTTLIVFPVYLLALTNPSLYLAIIMKSVSLGQQSSALDAKDAGRELLASTFLGGCFAAIFWFALKIQPNLWMFFLWTALFVMYFAAKLYGQYATRFPPSLWSNILITMLILVGPAVADSANGKDVYQAFAVRMALFVAVTLYAWAAIVVLEDLRSWPLRRRASSSLPEVPR